MSELTNKPICVLHTDTNGKVRFLFNGNVTVLRIDERTPNDRVNQLTRQTDINDLVKLIGSSVIRSDADPRNPDRVSIKTAITRFLKGHEECLSTAPWQPINTVPKDVSRGWVLWKNGTEDIQHFDVIRNSSYLRDSGITHWRPATDKVLSAYDYIKHVYGLTKDTEAVIDQTTQKEDKEKDPMTAPIATCKEIVIPKQNWHMALSNAVEHADTDTIIVANSTEEVTMAHSMALRKGKMIKIRCGVVDYSWQPTNNTDLVSGVLWVRREHKDKPELVDFGIADSNPGWTLGIADSNPGWTLWGVTHWRLATALELETHSRIHAGDARAQSVRDIWKQVTENPIQEVEALHKADPVVTPLSSELRLDPFFTSTELFDHLKIPELDSRWQRIHTVLCDNRIAWVRWINGATNLTMFAVASSSSQWSLLGAMHWRIATGNEVVESRTIRISHLTREQRMRFPSHIIKEIDITNDPRPTALVEAVLSADSDTVIWVKTEHDVKTANAAAKQIGKRVNTSVGSKQYCWGELKNFIELDEYAWICGTDPTRAGIVCLSSVDIGDTSVERWWNGRNVYWRHATTEEIVEYMENREALRTQ